LSARKNESTTKLSNDTAQRRGDGVEGVVRGSQRQSRPRKQQTSWKDELCCRLRNSPRSPHSASDWEQIPLTAKQCRSLEPMQGFSAVHKKNYRANENKSRAETRDPSNRARRYSRFS